MEANQQTNALVLAAAQAAGEGIDQQQYLTFSLKDEMFAIGILAVREIIEYGQVTPVPMSPPFIRGVINLRGAVVPVVDLSVRFGRPANGITKRTCIVIVDTAAGSQHLQMGVVVDAVSEVLEIPASDIEPPPEFGARIRTDFISGMGKVNGRFVVILNSDRVLSIEEVAVLASMAQAGTP
ncbi:MAG TPA: chemotaxis protein CheW [Rhodocyclaceae bacterium]|nr:chemotaxis protein CheW [Rhodocyclaceae bacterium]